MVKKIKFIISNEGEVRVDVTGVEGTSCEGLTEPFEKVLGPVFERTYKDSFYVENTESQSVSGEENGNA